MSRLQHDSSEAMPGFTCQSDVRAGRLGDMRHCIVVVALAFALIGCGRIRETRVEKPVGVAARWIEKIVTCESDCTPSNPNPKTESEGWGPLISHERDGRFRIAVGILAGTLCDSTL